MLNRRQFVVGAAAGLASARLMGAAQACPDGWPNGHNSCMPAETLTGVKPNVPVPEFQFEEKESIARPLLSEIIKHRGTLAHLRKKLTKGYSALAKNNLNNPENPKGYLREVWTHQSYCLYHGIHNTWQFLPWHRGFLYFHERLLRRLVDEDFRLPVWDWENIPFIPHPYAEWKCTPLMQRNPNPNFEEATNPTQVQAWLQTPEDDFQKFIGHRIFADVVPQAVSGPHSGVHGKTGGFMRKIPYSPADPLFFPHHANIDRYFEIWRQRYESNAVQCCSAYREWMDQPLQFFDHLGNNGRDPGWVTVKVSQLMDTKRLGYRYDRNPASNPNLPQFTSVPMRISDAENFVGSFERAALEAAVQSMQPSVPAFSHLAEELGNVIGRLARFQLPVSFQAVLGSGDEPGYYDVGIKRGRQNSRIIKLGGFGIFSAPDQMPGMDGMGAFAGTLSVSSDKISDLLMLLASDDTSLEFQLVYAPEKTVRAYGGFPGEAKVLKLRSLELHFPRA